MKKKNYKIRTQLHIHTLENSNVFLKYYTKFISITLWSDQPEWRNSRGGFYSTLKRFYHVKRIYYVYRKVIFTFLKFCKILNIFKFI